MVGATGFEPATTCTPTMTSGEAPTSEMHEEITRRAFPKLFKALYGSEDEPTEGE